MSFALRRLPLSQRLRGGVVRLRAALTLLGSARRVNGLALRAQLLSSSKMSYAAVASFPTSSFVLEAR